jgi:hypothetical protein
MPAQRLEQGLRRRPRRVLDRRRRAARRPAASRGPGRSAGGGSRMRAGRSPFITARPASVSTTTGGPRR